MTESVHVVLATGKCWQSPHYVVVWQILRHNDRRPLELPKKFYVVLNLTQVDFGLTLTDVKPDGLHADAAFTNMARKYLRQGLITGIFVDTQTQDIWLRFRASGEEEAQWYVQARAGKPPLGFIIHQSGDIYMGWGMEGTFTKRRKRDEPLPDFASPRFREISGELMVTLSRSLSPEAQTPADVAETSLGIDQEQRDLLNRLRRRLKTLRKTFDKQQTLVPSEEDLRDLEAKARMLQSYSYLVKEGDHSLLLNGLQTGLDADLCIDLDPDQSLGSNLDAYFTRIKKQKKARTMGERQLAQITADIHAVETDITRLASEPLSLAERATFFVRHKLPQMQAAPVRQSSAPVASPFRTYYASTGQRILVGKGASENDELTKKAKANDYWLHAVGVTGSHVIIPATRENRESLDPTTLREAAILALHYSKIKQDQAGEVYVTRKAHVKKRKDMPAGLWLVERSETIFFRYTQEEADRILTATTAPTPQ